MFETSFEESMLKWKIAFNFDYNTILVSTHLCKIFFFHINISGLPSELLYWEVCMLF